MQRESARRASLGRLVSLVADSYEKQTIASHKGSKIKAWKEKAVEKKKKKRRSRGGSRGKEPASTRGKTRKERRIERERERERERAGEEK